MLWILTNLLLVLCRVFEYSGKVVTSGDFDIAHHWKPPWNHGCLAFLSPTFFIWGYLKYELGEELCEDKISKLILWCHKTMVDCHCQSDRCALCETADFPRGPHM